jgi:CheY-like chemotaxis protein
MVGSNDHANQPEVVRRILESKGYRVLMARDGEEAVRPFEANWQKIGLGTTKASRKDRTLAQTEILRTA